MTQRAPDRPDSSRKPFEVARLALSQVGLHVPEELDASLIALCQISAESLQVARVGIWFFETPEHLRNLCLFELATRQVSGGMLLLMGNYPSYVAAIQTRRVVAVTDAPHDRKTHEMTTTYLAPLGIVSMMDAAIYLDGRIVGIVCHEQVGQARTWSQSDFDFAATVADVVSTLCEQARRMQNELQVRKLQEQISRADGAMALAQLATGVAHDLNNLLSIILLNAGALPSSPQRALIEEQCQLGARMAKQLQSFVRERPTPAVPIDLRSVVGELHPLLRAVLGPRCELRVALGIEPLLVGSSRSECEQLLFNLATNARAAMPQGGVFQIEGTRREGWVQLRVSDTGVGMTPDVRQRAFEPLFTTRGEHGGTGVGLTVVEGVMRRAQGTVAVDSAPGQGTSFVLSWPQAG